MKLCLSDLNLIRESGCAAVPEYSLENMKKNTESNPVWIHFGGGNIFRGFIAGIQDALLNQGFEKSGIIVGEGYDSEVISRIYQPFDKLALRILMYADGSVDRRVIGGIGAAISCVAGDLDGQGKLLIDAVKKDSLQLISFTITEKGYTADEHGIVNTACLLLMARYKSGGAPIAMVSMDNCSRNGELLRNKADSCCKRMIAEGKVDAGFYDYVFLSGKVSFPWTMIDKITPRPSPIIQRDIEDLGFEDMGILETAKHTYIAPFVNTESAEYLIVEDNFPNGRPAMERAGVTFTDRETVGKAERMKVMTCLNPLHTAMAIAGCLLGYKKISDEMEDSQIVGLIKGVAREGMKVVTDPGIISPEDFLNEVITERLPNPNIPDTPQRIVTDTSQKIPVRYGMTLQAYESKWPGSVSKLKFIPFVFALWLRYLYGKDDQGADLPLSSDPRLEELTGLVHGEVGQLEQILEDRTIFGLDLKDVGLSNLVLSFYKDMCSGPGSVRRALKRITC